MEYIVPLIWPSSLVLVAYGAYKLARWWQRRERQRKKRLEWNQVLWEKYLATVDDPVEREIQRETLKRWGEIE